MDAIMKFLGGLTALVILIVVTFFVSLLVTYIVLDIATLYDVKFIAAMSFKQLFGAIYIFGIIISRLKSKFDTEKNDTFSEQLAKGFLNAFSIAIGVLLSWWFAYIFYNFI